VPEYEESPLTQVACIWTPGRWSACFLVEMSSVINCRACGWHLAELHDRMHRGTVAQYLRKGNNANDLRSRYGKLNLTDEAISCTIVFVIGHKG